MMSFKQIINRFFSDLEDTAMVLLGIVMAVFMIWSSLCFSAKEKERAEYYKHKKQLFIESCVEHEPYYKCIKKYNEL